MKTEQRFIFDEVAELYARSRPGYPAELIEDVLNYTGGPGGPAKLTRMLEIGCGTGQATCAFASRGLSIVALEPGPNLARCARERVAHSISDAAANRVEIRTTTFEDYALPSRSFDLVVSAQAFHWVSPEVRYSKSAAALRAGGVLAVFGNKPHHADSKVYEEIDAAYEECAPSMLSTPPAHDACTATDAPMVRAFAEAADFSELKQHSYPWNGEYTANDYIALMRTQSNHRLLPSALLEALLARIHGAIEGAGGSLVVPYVAHLIMGRRAGH